MIKNILIILIIVLLIIYIKNSKEGFKNLQNKDYIIAMFLTGGLCEEAANSIYTLKKLNLDDKLIVTCLDEQALKCIKKLGVKTRFRNLQLANEASHGTKKFLEITRQKLIMIDELLNLYEVPILYTDTDIVFLKNFSSDIPKYLKKNDITFQSDSKYFEETLKNVCTGFILFNNNNKSKKFVKKAKEIMSDSKKLNWKPGDLADQKATNMAIKEVKNIKIGLFDNYEYANGARYFDNKNTVYEKRTPTIIHNNWIRGLDNKVARFKKYGLWFID